MKKLLLSIFGIAATFAIASADTVEYNVNDATDFVGTEVAEKPAEGSSNGEARHVQPLTSFKLGDYSFSFTKGAGTTDPAYYYVMSTNTSGQNTVRLYKSNTMTVTAPAGTNMSKVEFTLGSAAAAATFSNVSNGAMSMSGTTTVVWAGNTNALTFTLGGANIRITNVKITTGEGSGQLEPTNGIFEETATIESGESYVFVFGSQYGAPIAETATYGRLSLVDTNVADGKINVPLTAAITINNVEGKGYTLVDAYDRFLGMAEGYATSFQLYKEVNDGCYWSATVADGKVTFTNTLVANAIICQSMGTSGTYYTNAAPAVSPAEYNLPALYILTGSTTPDPVDPDPVDENLIYEGLLQTSTAIDWTIENVTLPEEFTEVWAWKSYNNAYYLNGTTNKGGTAYDGLAYATSPVIDLTDRTDITVDFEHAAKFQTSLKTLCAFQVKEEGNADWTDLTIPTWPAAGGWTFVNCGNIDLNAYAGKKIQLRFKYEGSTAAGADTWEIRDLHVKGTKASGIAALEADNANAPVEFFNLQGVRVSGDALTPGLYIRRQGSATAKILVK